MNTETSPNQQTQERSPDTHSTRQHNRSVQGRANVHLPPQADTVLLPPPFQPASTMTPTEVIYTPGRPPTDPHQLHHRPRTCHHHDHHIQVLRCYQRKCIRWRNTSFPKGNSSRGEPTRNPPVRSPHMMTRRTKDTALNKDRESDNTFKAK